MEAFQLSLGRNEELDLAAMIFRSEVVETGKQISNSTVEGTGKCILSHANAGANNLAPGLNFNFNTGVEELPVQPARLVDPSIPRDGGFGQDPDGKGGFGNGNFNTPSIVEAADTAPLFHNNSINTIETSVAFFNSKAFNNSPSGAFIGGIQLEATQVIAIAAFLRTINALENIRNSNQLDEQAKKADIYKGEEILEISLAEIDDAIDVLTGGTYHLYRNAIQKVEKARNYIHFASNACNLDPFFRNRLIDQAIGLKNAARSLILVERGS